MIVKITVRDRDYDEVEIEVPGHYVVCDRCDGSGTIVNPSVDGNGITPEQFAEDPDFEDAYFRGVFDIHCPQCHGLRVVAQPDVSQMTYAQKRMMVWKRISDRLDAEMRSEELAERRYCYGY